MKLDDERHWAEQTNAEIDGILEGLAKWLDAGVPIVLADSENCIIDRSDVQSGESDSTADRDELRRRLRYYKSVWGVFPKRLILKANAAKVQSSAETQEGEINE